MITGDLTLARRLERCLALGNIELVQTQQQHFPEIKADYRPVADGHVFFTGATGYVANAFGLGLERPVTAAEIDEVEQFLQERDKAPAIWVCPQADRSLFEEIGRRGYRIGFFLNTFVRPLAGFVPHDVPGVTVTVATPDQAYIWEQTVRRGFGEETPGGRSTFTGAVFLRPKVTAYIAWVDGEPAGAAGMDIIAGCATFFSTSTLTHYRGRGVQMALLQARLRDAAAQGCDIAMVLTSPGNASHRNVQRAGFQVAYTKLTMVRS